MVLKLHPFETLVQRFLSSDHQLMPETIKQLHLLEIWVILAGVGLLLLAFFFKHWQRLEPQKIKGTICFLILVSAVLMRVVSAERGYETMEFLDSVHYTVSAQEFLKSGQFRLPLNQENHPSSKAPGFALLIAPFYLVLGDHLGSAVFCPLLLGIFSLLLFYRLSKSLLGEQTALIAFLLLSFSPLHITYSRLIMPSMGSLFFILLGTLLLTSKRVGFKKLWVAGLCFGFAAVIRYLAVAVIPAAMLYLLLKSEENFRERFKKVLALLLGAAIPLSLLFYYQWEEFGSPWLTGYSYWTYFYVNTQKPFSWDYAFNIPPTSGGSPNFWFMLISATGVHIPYPNILGSRPDQIGLAILVWAFATIGLAHLYQKNRPLFFFVLFFFGGYYLPHAFVFSQGSHFMLPVIPFIFLSAAFGFYQLFQKLSLQIQSLGSGLLFIVLITFIPLAYSFSHVPFEQTRKEYIQLMKTNLPDESFLISDYEPILFTYAVGREKKITFIAVSPQVVYADRQLYSKGIILPPPVLAAIQHLEKIHQWLKEKRPIYLSSFSEEEFASDYQRIAKEFHLNLVAKSEHFKLYQLDGARNRESP